MLVGLENDREHAALPLGGLPVVEPGQGFDFLRGVRVLDLTTSVAGPMATMLLADLGATVIKVERPGSGDDARAWGPPFLEGESLWFMSVNRNKLSVTLDYSVPKGRAVLGRLIGSCDVFIVNQPPALARRRGVDPETVRGENGRIVYVSITGFGLEGERADWTCYDLIAEGYSGVMDLTGEFESPPQKVGAPAADMLAGQDAALAAVSALFAREREGRGCVVDIALVNSMTRFLACRIVPYLGSGELPRRSGARDSVIAVYQTFETADDPMTLALGNDSIWRRFWAAVGQPEVAENDAHATNAGRVADRARIVERIQEVLRTRSRDEWLALMREARVPAGPIYRLDEVAADLELRRQRMVYGMRDGDRLVPQVGTGFAVDGAHNVPRCPPPRLGEHTDEILGGLLGYDDGEIAALRGERVI